MFSNVYHNGDNGIEIFSPSGNDPFRHMKLVNENHIHKVYERTVKGYVVSMERESSSTALICPKQQKDSLDIHQSLLILQLRLLGMASPFSLELVVHDSRRQRKRLYFSTSFKDIHVNSLHVSLPWKQPRHDLFTNVVIDMMQLVYQSSNGMDEFVSLDSFIIHPCCQLRRIFTLPRKYLMSGLSGGLSTSLIEIPAKYDFISGVNSRTWMYTTTMTMDDDDHHHADELMISSAIDGIDGHRIVGSQPSNVATAHHHSRKDSSSGGILITTDEDRDAPSNIIPHSTQVDIGQVVPQHHASNPWGPTAVAAVSDHTSARLHGKNETCFIGHDDDKDDVRNKSMNDTRDDKVDVSDQAATIAGHIIPLLFSSRLKKKITTNISSNSHKHSSLALDTIQQQQQQQQRTTVRTVATEEISSSSSIIAPASIDGKDGAMIYHEDSQKDSDGSLKQLHMVHSGCDVINHGDEGFNGGGEEEDDKHKEVDHLSGDLATTSSLVSDSHDDLTRYSKQHIIVDHHVSSPVIVDHHVSSPVIVDHHVSSPVIVDHHVSSPFIVDPMSHSDEGMGFLHNHKIGYRDSKMIDNGDGEIDDDLHATDEDTLLLHDAHPYEEAVTKRNGYSDGGIELLPASHDYGSRDNGLMLRDNNNQNVSHGPEVIDRYNDRHGAAGCSAISDFQRNNKIIHNQWIDRFRAVETSTLHLTDNHQAIDKASSLLAAIDHLELQYVMTYGVPAFETELGFFAPGVTSLYEL